MSTREELLFTPARELRYRPKATTHQSDILDEMASNLYIYKYVGYTCRYMYVGEARASPPRRAPSIRGTGARPAQAQPPRARHLH
jgi:hypothetical protein